VELKHRVGADMLWRLGTISLKAEVPQSAGSLLRGISNTQHRLKFAAEFPSEIPVPFWWCLPRGEGSPFQSWEWSQHFVITKRNRKLKLWYLYSSL